MHGRVNHHAPSKYLCGLLSWGCTYTFIVQYSPIPGRPPPLVTPSGGGGGPDITTFGGYGGDERAGPLIPKAGGAGQTASTGRSTTPRRMMGSVVQFDNTNLVVQPRARTPRRR